MRRRRSARSLFRGFLLGTLVLGCAGQNAATKSKRDAELPKPNRELQLPGQAFVKTYDNGLTLFIVPDAYTRLVQFDVRQQVGSREDPPGKEGPLSENGSLRL